MHADSAKYLLIRLCLRKPGKWHRLSSLKYQRDLGENITTGLEMLCACPTRPSVEEHVTKQEEREVIDLTLDEMEPESTVKPPPAPYLETVEAGPSSIKLEDIPEESCGDLSFFAQDETHAELHELLECLSMEELKQLAKDMKIKTSLNVSGPSVTGLILVMTKDICTAGSNRKPVNQTGIFAVYSHISFCAPESKGCKAAKNTNTTTFG